MLGRKRRDLVFNITFKTLLVVAGLCLSGCQHLLYHPTKLTYYPPEKVGLKPQEVFIQVDDSEKIHAWHFESQMTPKALIVFFHGNAQNISSHYMALAWATKKDMELLVFDYRGYGRSDGEVKTQNTIEDGHAVLNWAEQNSELPLVVFGQSLGGAVAMKVVSERENKSRIKLLAVESTFASYRMAAQDALARPWLTWPFQWMAHFVLSDKYAPKGHLEKLSPVPLLVIHGTRDPIIEFKRGQEVFDLAREPKEFWSVENGRHIDAFQRENGKYRKMFLKKIRQLIKG